LQHASSYFGYLESFWKRKLCNERRRKLSRNESGGETIMSLRIVYGRADTDKSDYIVNEIKDELQANPDGRPIFYIVPEQMTFQQEYGLFQDDDVKGSIRAQVVSFSRLAWRLMQETGGATKQFISSTGIQMMLRKIIDQRTERFKVFQ